MLAVSRTMARMTAPTISLGMVATFVFQIVDTYFVGKLGADELAAVAFAGTTYLIGLGAFMGAAVGTSAVVGRAIGEHRIADAQRITLLSLAITSVAAAALSLIGWATIGPLSNPLGAEGAVLELI